MKAINRLELSNGMAVRLYWAMIRVGQAIIFGMVGLVLYHSFFG